MSESHRVEAARHDPAYGLHPALLDAALHAALATAGEASARVPFAWHGVRLHLDGARLFNAAVASLSAEGGTGIVLDVRTGGSWSLSLPVGEGGEMETMTGGYGEVITKELLTIITHFDGGDTEMEFRFEPVGPGTRIAVRQSSPSREQRDGSREGAEMLLALCAQYLARARR